MEATLRQKLQQIAVLGLSNAKMEDELLKELQPFLPNNAHANSQATTLWNVLAAQQLMERVGSILPKHANTTALCEAETLRVYPNHAHCQLLFEKYADTLLPTFLQHLVANSYLLPPWFLPDVLEHCKREASLWEMAQHTIGKRGEWLIAQNELWQHFAPKTNISTWESGSSKARIAHLKQARREDASQALSLLNSTWETENKSDKINLLATLREGLSENDVPFLYTIWREEKQKEVKQMAGTLLARSQNAHFSEELLDVYAPHLDIKQKKLRIDFPKHLKSKATRAEWLEGIGFIAPSAWERLFKQQPNAILSAFTTSDVTEIPLQNALLQAAILHEDNTWIALLLQEWLYHKINFNKKQTAELLDQVSPLLFEKIMLAEIANSNKLPDANSHLAMLLLHYDKAWTEKASKVYLLKFKEWTEGKRYTWQMTYCKDVVKKMAAHCPLSVFSDLHHYRPHFSDKHDIESQWLSLENILQFRQSWII